MKPRLTPLLLATFLATTSATTSATTPVASASGINIHCPKQKLQVEQLPDLNLPRSGHHTFAIGDELIVMGGHTDGFVPTPTAEYYSNGCWQLLPMVYPHDQGVALTMKSGNIMIAGGHEQPLGIGQLFSVELYHPDTHTFEGYGCLDRKRCFADAVELDSGCVIITGNWYHTDAIEQYCGKNLLSHVKDVSQQRSQPYVMRTAVDDAIVFGTHDLHDSILTTIVVDRLRGEPFTEPLLNQWRPLRTLLMPHTADSFIGDESTGHYTYLLTAQNDEGELAILKVENGRFSLLPTKQPIPRLCGTDSITYFSYIVADRTRHRAYLVGTGSLLHDTPYYVLAIDYEKRPADLTLYYTDTLHSAGIIHPVLTPDGNLVVAGGFRNNNFKPRAAVYRLCVATPPASLLTSFASHLTPLIVIVVLLAVAIGIIVWRPTSHTSRLTSHAPSFELLFQQICQLMDEKRPYLNNNLKVRDVATEIGVSSRTVSDAVKICRGCSFAQFINGYRIEYAKLLLQNRPDIKMTNVYMKSGFSNEMSFFRTFKAFTGVTPKEWMAPKD